MSPAADAATRPAAPGLPAAFRIQLGLLVFLVFVTGVLVGLLANRLRSADDARPMGAEGVFFERFSDDFDLDREQRRILRLVLEEKARQKSEWWNDLLQRAPDQRRFLEINRRTDRLIRMLLEERQREIYDARLRRSEVKW